MDPLTALRAERFQLVDRLGHLLRQIDALDQAIAQQEARRRLPAAVESYEDNFEAQLRQYLSSGQEQMVQSPLQSGAVSNGAMRLERELPVTNLENLRGSDLESLLATDLEILLADDPPRLHNGASTADSFHIDVSSTATRRTSDTLRHQPTLPPHQEDKYVASVNAAEPGARQSAQGLDEVTHQYQRNLAHIRALAEGEAIDDPAYWSIVRSGDYLIELQCPDPNCRANCHMGRVPKGDGGTRRERILYKGLLGLRRHVSKKHIERGWFGISDGEALKLAQKVRLNDQQVEAVLHRRYDQYEVERCLPKR